MLIVNQFLDSNDGQESGPWQVACWIGIVLTLIDFALYTTYFGYVYCRAGLSNYGWGTFLILSWPALFLALCAFEPFLHILTSGLNPSDTQDTCWIYNPNDPYAILIESA